jgi:hypothetical protein
VSEDDFKANYSKNPLNLLTDCNYCDHPQPRYKLVHNRGNAKPTPEFKFLGYKQCLPGCTVIRSPSDNFSKLIAYHINAEKFSRAPVWLTNDTKCVAFDARDCSNAPNCTTTPHTTISPVNFTDSSKSPIKGELLDSLNRQGKI